MRALLFIIALAGCADDEEPVAPLCANGAWEQGDTPSPLMNPGEACLACHETVDGPVYTAAGTVFAELDDPNDCNGVAGVTVEIEDADGKVVTRTSNAAGNFFVEDEDFRLPIIARVTRDGRTVIMPRYVYGTDCNDCHTQTGTLGAPGRVKAP